MKNSESFTLTNCGFLEVLERSEQSGSNPSAVAYHALAREKETHTALREIIAKYHESGAYQIAEVYAFRNQSDEAFEWLDRAYAQHDSSLTLTKVDPLLKSLYQDPRYAAFLKKLDLPT
jgi:hypothetical protein